MARVLNDFSQAGHGLGRLDGILDGLSTTVHVNHVLRYTYEELRPKFNRFIDGVAGGVGRKQLHHVYEWEMVGVPAGRLFRVAMRGQGRNRIVKFEFLPSKVLVPIDPILLQPGPTGRSVNPDIHIFHWKAPVMEAGLHITVTPKLAKWLAFVGDRQDGNSGRSDAGPPNDTGIRFARETSFIAGGGDTTGQFTKLFVGWWTEEAPILFSGKIKKKLERQAGTTMRKTKQIAISPGGFAEARERGYAAALREIQQQDADFFLNLNVERAGY